MKQLMKCVGLMVLVGSMISLACDSGSSGSEKKSSEKDTEYWPEISDEVLYKQLAQKCEAAKLAEKPLLLEFSAGWCKDCKELKKYKETEVVKNELKNWETQLINVGRHDRHKKLIEHFEIKSIARNIVIMPNENCGKQPEEWKMASDTVVEPLSDKEHIGTAEAYANWLKSTREKVTT